MYTGKTYKGRENIVKKGVSCGKVEGGSVGVVEGEMVPYPFPCKLITDGGFIFTASNHFHQYGVS